MLTCKYTGLKEIDRRTVIDRTCAGLNFYVEAHHVKRLNLYDAHRVMFMFLSLFSSLTLSLSLSMEAGVIGLYCTHKKYSMSMQPTALFQSQNT